MNIYLRLEYRDDPTQREGETWGSMADATEQERPLAYCKAEGERASKIVWGYDELDNAAEAAYAMTRELIQDNMTTKINKETGTLFNDIPAAANRQRHLWHISRQLGNNWRQRSR